MPVLKNPAHERFAQLRAKGVSASEAYVKAGFKKHDGNASRLSGNEKVQARVNELIAKGAEKAGVTVERIINELAKIAFSDIRRALDWGLKETPDGPVQFVTLKHSADVDDDTAATVSEVWQTNQGISFKFHDKPQALDKLARHLGMYKDEVNVMGNLVVERVSFCADDE